MVYCHRAVCPAGACGRVLATSKLACTRSEREASLFNRIFGSQSVIHVFSASRVNILRAST